MTLAGCLPGDLVICVQLMEEIMIGKHDVTLWSVVMGQPTASFETRMGHASILKVAKAADEAFLDFNFCVLLSLGNVLSISETCQLRWKRFTRPQAAVVQNEGSMPESRLEVSDRDDDDEGAAVSVQPDRDHLLKEAAGAEVRTFISTLVHDEQDAAKLNKALFDLSAVQRPLGNHTRLVVHWVWSKEAEASQTFTRSHNIFERIPGLCRNRASVVKQTLDLMLGDRPEAYARVSSCRSLSQTG